MRIGRGLNLSHIRWEKMQEGNHNPAGFLREKAQRRAERRNRCRRAIAETVGSCAKNNLAGKIARLDLEAWEKLFLLSVYVDCRARRSGSYA